MSPNEASEEWVEPTYGCGHRLLTLLHGSPAERKAEYWRSVRINCPKCAHLPSPKPLGPAHLQGHGDPSALCTFRHPCSYRCWAERNAFKAEAELGIEQGGRPW